MAAAIGTVDCPSCHRPNPTCRVNCWGCGAAFPKGVEGAGGPAPTALSSPGDERAGAPEGRGPGARPPALPSAAGLGDTGTGLLLMMVGFGLGCIPVIGGVGGIPLLIGLVYLWNGRGDFPEPHARCVRWGVALIPIGLLAAVAAGAASVFLFPSSGLLTELPWVLAVGEVVLLLPAVLLTYALARPVSRVLLWAGYVAGVGSALAVAYLRAAVISAISAPVGMGTSSTGVPSAQTVLVVGYALPIVPNLLFLLAYHRVRRDLVSSG